jgi:hypothetical protein
MIKLYWYDVLEILCYVEPGSNKVWMPCDNGVWLTSAYVADGPGFKKVFTFIGEL